MSSNSSPPLFSPAASSADVPADSCSLRVVKSLLQMTREILGGSGAWLVEKRNEKCTTLIATPAGGQASPLPESVASKGFQHDQESQSVCVDGFQFVFMDVIQAPSASAVSHLVAIMLQDRIILRERAKGVLDGIRCAFATALSELDRSSKVTRIAATPNQIVCCSACRKIQTGQGTWGYWDELPDRNFFRMPVSHTVCEACAIKLYGLALVKDSLKSGDPVRMGCYDYGY